MNESILSFITLKNVIERSLMAGIPKVTCDLIRHNRIPFLHKRQVFYSVYNTSSNDLQVGNSEIQKRHNNVKFDFGLSCVLNEPSLTTVDLSLILKTSYTMFTNKLFTGFIKSTF